MTQAGWRAEIEEAYPRVYRSLVAMGASPEDAADALQDACERALQEKDAIARPNAWLFVVALRRWRTMRWRSRLFVPLDVLRAHPAAAPPGDDTAALLAEVRRLPRREREVFACRYLLGLSQQETAAALGMAIGTVGATTAHATKKLREKLDERDERSRPASSTAR